MRLIRIAVKGVVRIYCGENYSIDEAKGDFLSSYGEEVADSNVSTISFDEIGSRQLIGFIKNNNDERIYNERVCKQRAAL